MSLTQTYYLAHTARGKLSVEAGRADHDLRLLVGHANLLDTLMLELAEAEEEQESWFNQSVKGASKASGEAKHIQWADAVVEEPGEDWDVDDAGSSDSDSDDEYDEYDEDIELCPADPSSFQRTPASMPPPYTASVVELDDIAEDDEAECASLSLTLSPSHASHHTSPPELLHDSDDDSSEDDSMPPSPPIATMPTFSEKQREHIVTTSYYHSKPEQDQDDDYYTPQRAPPPMAGTISVC